MKPIAWIGIEAIDSKWRFGIVTQEKRHESDIPLYTHPAELTDEEIAQAWAETKGDMLHRLMPFARAILRKAQEK